MSGQLFYCLSTGTSYSGVYIGSKYKEYEYWLLFQSTSSTKCGCFLTPQPCLLIQPIIPPVPPCSLSLSPPCSPITCMCTLNIKVDMQTSSENNWISVRSLKFCLKPSLPAVCWTPSASLSLRSRCSSVTQVEPPSGFSLLQLWPLLHSSPSSPACFSLPILWISSILSVPLHSSLYSALFLKQHLFIFLLNIFILWQKHYFWSFLCIPSIFDPRSIMQSCKCCPPSCNSWTAQLLIIFLLGLDRQTYGVGNFIHSHIYSTLQNNCVMLQYNSKVKTFLSSNLNEYEMFVKDKYNITVMLMKWGTVIL